MVSVLPIGKGKLSLPKIRQQININKKNVKFGSSSKGGSLKLNIKNWKFGL